MAFTFAEKVQCIEREIAMRKRVYPSWVAKGKMKSDMAEYQIAAMEDILADMQKLKRMQDLTKDWYPYDT